MCENNNTKESIAALKEKWLSDSCKEEIHKAVSLILSKYPEEYVEDIDEYAEDIDEYEFEEELDQQIIREICVEAARYYIGDFDLDLVTNALDNTKSMQIYS